MVFLEEISGRFGDAYSREFVDIIEQFAPNASRFLEWGSGESTQLLCTIAQRRADPFVMSIDDNGEYIRRVSGSLPCYPFLHFRQLDLQGPSRDQRDSLPSYSSYPYLINLDFDVIFIDGRRRSECALTASQILSNSGIVIIHDWRRSRYAIIRTLFEIVYEGEQFLVGRPKAGIRVSRQRLGDGEERRVIIIPVNGARAERELEITLPWTEAYARKVHADCIVVGQASLLPPTRLKYEAFEVAKSYDRCMIIDADVIIRPDSPDIFDIVPRECLGAFPEGVYFPREDWCHELNALYGLENKLQSYEYFNSGILVLSKENYQLIESLKEDTLFGHPQFEQGFLNARRVSLGIPLFSLPIDFNYIPNLDAVPVDWRYGFFIHLAGGSGKQKYHYHELWEDKASTRNTFSKRKIMPADTRGLLLKSYADQLKGRNVRYFDATDLFYITPHAFPLFDVSGEIIFYFPEQPACNELKRVVYGPYIDLPAGKWTIEFIYRSDYHFSGFDGFIDVTSHHGTFTILDLQPWPAEGKVEFVIECAQQNVEFRIYRAQQEFEFLYLKLECDM